MFDLLIALIALVAGIFFLVHRRRGMENRGSASRSEAADGDAVETGPVDSAPQGAWITAPAEREQAPVPLVSAMRELTPDARIQTAPPLDPVEPSIVAETSGLESQFKLDGAKAPESLPVNEYLNVDVAGSVDEDRERSHGDDQVEGQADLIDNPTGSPVDAPLILAAATPGISEVQPTLSGAPTELELASEVAQEESASGPPDAQVRNATPIDGDAGSVAPIIDATPSEDLDFVANESGDPNTDDGSEEAGDVDEREEAPHRYRPAPRLPRAPRSRTSKSAELGARDRSLDVLLRLSFRSGGACHFSLLARRPGDLPDQIEVRGRNRMESLRSLQDDWYELKAPSDLGALLRDGAVWTSTPSSEASARWTLASRDVFVLGVSADFAGYVSTARLAIGEPHVVLCTSSRREDVAAALTTAGCLDTEWIDVASGVPEGWLVARNVRPSIPVSSTNDGDVLDTLRPLADIAIHLEAGIKVDRSAWLEGYPPTVRIVGDLASAGALLIDDTPTVIAADGTCESPRKGELGEHTVWSSSTSRNYSVIRGIQEWPPWLAHPMANAMVCGAAVFPLPGSRKAARQVVVPVGDLSLIGATPGEVLHCSHDATSVSRVTLAFPAFEPAWIVPRFPLRCDRRSARVIGIGPRRVSRIAPATGHRPSVVEWSRLILDAKRRKLIIDPTDEPSRILWLEYQQVARSIWRRFR